MQESQTITRKSASNLALAFVLLPKEKRNAMSTLYAFCRQVDDVADEESIATEKRRSELARWREDIRRACNSEPPSFTVNRELQPFIHQYHLPFAQFDDLIRGVEMDLDIKRYPDYPALEQYCYRVASVVGLLSIEIFGYSDPKARDYAVFLGQALQLTNILRDVRSDAERGRIYLPLSELARFKVTEEEILSFKYSNNYLSLAESVAARSKEYYRKAAQSLAPRDRRSMIAAELMGSVYWRLLEKLEAERFNVFGPTPVKLSKSRKLLLMFKAWLRLTLGSTSPSFGNV